MRTRMRKIGRSAAALLLALVMLLGAVPPGTLTAYADGDDSITLTGCDFTGTSYHSAVLGTASIHTMQFDYNGGTTGFCADHGKGMGRSLIGQSWGSRTEITDPTVRLMLAYYYAHTQGIFTDAAKAAGVDFVWDEGYTNYMNAWVQAVIWRYRTGTLTSPVEDCAEELMWVYNCLRGEHNTDIDQVNEGGTYSFRHNTQYIFDLGTATWGDTEVYLYEFSGAGSASHPAESVQNIIVGRLKTTTDTEDYRLTVKKTDVKTGLPLAGAVFHVEGPGGLSWDVTTAGSAGTATLEHLSPGTYAITETKAPNGYLIDNPGPEYVVLPSGAGNTVTKTFADSPDVTPSGEIRKVDADNPTKGLAGAVIAIQGISVNFYGEYVTDAAGYLTGVDWTGMGLGSYRAWETTPPEGYSLSDEVKTFRIDSENPNVKLVFKNDAKVKVRLLKLDGSDNPLPGAVFNVFRDGQLIATQATDSAGQITLTDVETGLYVFVETAAPEGYAKLAQPLAVYVDQASIDGSGVVTVTATDKKLPDLTIRKQDAATGEAVPYTTFEIVGIHSGYRREVVTGSDGTATLTGIPVDDYEVTEKNVPAPYTLSAEGTQTVWLGAGEHPTLVFSNLEQPKLSILKLDAETSAPIPGVVFNVQGIDVDYSGDWTTGADGKYTAQITPGSYRITETSVPAPYSLSANNVRTVALAAGSQRELVFENLKNPMLNLTKIDALDGRVVPGTVFAVTGLDNSYSGDWTTGTDGTVSQRLEPGTYRVTEKSVPAPYYLSEEGERTQTVSLSAGEIRGLVFKDYKTPAIRIYKLDSISGAPIEGAKFHVTYTSSGGATGAPATYDFGELYTNADGEIPLHECGVQLYPGEYTVTETDPAPGFQMRQPTTQSVILNGSESRSVTFYNAPLNGIIVEKYDAVTGLAVPGATFRLRYLGGSSGTGGTVIGEKTTGPSGSAIWTGLEAGTYVVEEIRAPEGYSIVRSSQTVYLAANGEQSVVTVSFENSPDGSLLIRKIDAKTRQPMAGIEFLVTDAKGTFIGTGNGRFLTDSSGSILIGNITPGTTLVVRETRTLPGYILDTTPQTCMIQEGKTTTLEFRNEPDGTIILYKKDAVTGAALSGVQFTVTRGNGELVAIADGRISSNGIYYTDDNGQIILSGIAPDTYVITETAAISGYILDRTPHSIAVTAGDTQTITITNQPKGRLLLQKYDRLTRTALPGAEFRIVPADSSLKADNEGLTSSTNLYVTDADGQISLENLTPGVYLVTETAAPDGYAIDSTTRDVMVRSGRTETVNFYDSQLATLQILKRDAVSKQPLADAEFTVTTADGTRLGDNNGVYITDEDGTATVTGIQPNSAVIVTESSSPAGYVMNATPKNIVVRSGAVNSLTFEDEPKTTLIVHKYISGTRNTPLSGVEFKVANSKGEACGMNNGIYTTDAQGEFMVTGLDPGLTVTVRETKTADGYVLDGTPQDIVIKAGERQELTFWNQRKGTLIVRKLDSETGNPISGVEFHIAYANGNPVDRNNGLLSSNGQYFTDSRGEIVLTDVVGTIVATEVNAAPGYCLDPASRTQTVIVNPEDAQTITFFNTPTQTLTLQKYEADSTTPIPGVRFHITDSEGNNIGSSNGDFVTDRNGQIVLNNLIPGTTVIARESTVPEDYVLDASPHSILIRPGEAQTLTVYNQRRANLLVRKIDSATGDSLPGARFKITMADGGTIPGCDSIFTTDRAGQITLNKLAPGAYLVTEVQAPEGYVLNGQTQTVVLGAAETKTVTIGNAAKGSLVIRKFDSVTRQPLSGAEFHVSKADGTPVSGSFVTDAGGQITLSGLDSGSYVVTEYAAPENYYLSAQSQTVAVTPEDVRTVSFYDEPFAALSIIKRDSVTLAPLSGAEFSVRDSGGEVIARCVTGTDGTTTISGLAPSAALMVTETRAPAGYVLTELPRTVRVRSGEPNTVVFDDAPVGSLVIRKYITGTANEPLPGAAFKITDGTGRNLGPDDGVYYTDSNGEITLTGLTPGTTVKAREIRTVEGFALDAAPQDITIQPGQTQQLTFWNPRKGSLRITKLDSVTRSPLSGVMFRITAATGEYLPNHGGASGYFTTDAAGEILLTGVTGTLTVTEFSTISGYMIDEASRTRTVTVNPDTTEELVFYNEPMTTLTVQKYASGTTTPLPGAAFLVTDSRGNALGNAAGRFVTDENGRFVLTDLIPGQAVVVRETAAPEGYVLDAAPQTVHILGGSSAQALTFYNAPKSSLAVRKVDALTGQPLSGAEFRVTTASGVPVTSDGGRTGTNGIYRTDEHGQFLITKLEPGVYTLAETQAPEGYILDAAPMNVTLQADDAQTITVRNQPKQTLTVQKFAADSDIPISGAEFFVSDSRGTAIGPENGKYTTDLSGRFVVSGLTPGQTLTVRETKAASGYILNGTPQSITIAEGSAQTLMFRNETRSALRIVKRDSVTEQPLRGAEFQVLTADGNFVESFGGRQSSNGIFTTDASGEILIPGLNPCVLVVKETKAPAGYVLDDTPQTVELHAAETQTLTFRDVPKQTVTLTKYEEGTTKPIAGAAFLVTDGGGNQLGEFVTDASGRIAIPGIAPGTTVVAREVKAASGYALNGEPQSIEVRAGAANTMTFYNAPLSVLVIRKYIEGTANEPLSGVTFKVTDERGANVGTDDGIFYTDAAGEIRIENLEPGTVLEVREIKTVDGFALDGTPRQITMQSGVEQELRLWNKRLGTLTVRKLDSVTRQPLPGVEFQIAYADGRKIGDSNGIFTTDSRGEINITGLHGTVTVTETATIPGYVMGTDRTQTVTVEAQTAKTVTFTNDPMQTLTIRKYQAGTSTPIPGAVFLVSDSTGAAPGRNNGEFTTDSHGEIIISGLIPGTTVTAREIRPASGFVLHSDPQSISIRQGEAQSMMFYNTPLEKLTIWKLVEGTDKPLSGVMFHVTDGAGTPIGSGEFVTDETGQIVIPGLIPGTTILAREVKTVRGYSLNSTPKSIQIASGRENALTFYDAPLATLVIHKVTEGTGSPLPGVTFKVVDGTGANIGSTDGLFVTDAAGDITIPNLEAGTVIKVREVKTVDGYVLDGTAQDIQIRSGELHELTFYNTPKKGLVIRKYITDSTTPIPGVTFHISDADGAAVGGSNGDYVTDANGEIILSGLTPGDVLTVRETKAASGFVLDSTPQTVRILSGNTPQALVFYNSPKSALTVRKVDSLTGQPLSGAEFRILTAQGQSVDANEGRTSTSGLYRTDANGEIRIDKLDPGVYTVAETSAPEGYVLDTAPQTVTISHNDAQTVTFRDVPKQGLTIRKCVSGTNTPIPGTLFLVTDEDGSPVGESAGEFRTDENGRIFLTGLIPGTTITAREIQAAEGFVPDGTPKSIKIKSGAAQTLNFYDVPTQHLVIRKLASGSNTPLSGVRFHVADTTGRALGTSNGDFVTDANGEILLDGLIPGMSVTVRETQALAGYVLDATPQTIRIESGEAQSLVFFNAPKSSIFIRKLDARTDRPLSGAAFKVTTAKGESVEQPEDGILTGGIYRTDENGEILLKNLLPGVYRIAETTAPEGYVLNTESQTVTLDTDEARTLIFRDEPLETLTIKKYEDGTTKPLEGVTFLVTDAGGNRLGQGEYVTDRNGQIVLTGLVPGTAVVVREVRTVRGYILNGEPQTIQIGAVGASLLSVSASGTASATTGNSLTFYDSPLSTLIIHKFMDGTDHNPLPGATFLVVDGSGKPVGNSDGLYITDNSGDIVIRDLEPGTVVTVREVKAPEGFVLDGTPQDIQIQNSEVHELLFWNTPTQNLTIRKYEQGTNIPIPGALFFVTEDGQPSGEANGEYQTDEHGEILLTGLIPGATITAKEIRAADGYVLDATPKTIRIRSGEAQSLNFYNVPTQRLVVQKYVANSATPIPGVTFHITDTDGKALGTSNGDFVTDRSGQILLEDLAPGMSVTVRETKAASGFVLDSTPQTVKIESGGAQTVVFYNTPKGSLTIVKTDSLTGEKLPGAEFKITTAKGEPADQNEGQTSTGGIYRTDENGEIRLLNLDPGVYRVEESKAPEGYVLSAEAQTVTVNANDAQTLTFRNVPTQTLTIQVYEQGTTKPIPGVAFLLKGSGGAVIGTENGEFISDANGQITVSNLTPGVTVNVQEIRTVTGYVLNNAPQTIRIQSGDAQKLTFYNVPTVKLTIHSFVAGTDRDPLSGVTFKVVDSSGKVVGNTDGIYESDAAGDIVISDLVPGTVIKVREIRTVDGYILDGTPQDIELRGGEANELTFWNVPRGSLTLIALDSLTEEPLPGAEFKVTTAKGTVVDQDGGNTSTNGIYRTDENGRFTITGLLPGTYVVTETKAPEGYVLNTEAQTVTVNASDAQTVTFRNAPKQTLIIQVYEEGTTKPIPGVAVLLKDSSDAVIGTENGEFTSDANGQITVSDLTPGVTVNAQEIRTVTGYVLNNVPQTIKVQSGDAQRLTFYNVPTVTLMIHKFAEGTDNRPISGATFKVMDGSGKMVGNAEGLYLTDDSGEIVIRELEPGTVIRVQEVKAAEGYVLNGKPQSIQIQNKLVNELTFWNTPKQRLILRTCVKGSNTPIPGVTVHVTDSDGEVIGSSNGDFVTDAHGEIVIAGLTPGMSVIAKMTEVPGNYVPDTTSQTIQIKSGDAQTMVFYCAPRGSLTLIALDSLTEEPLPGAEFKVTTAKGTAVDQDEGNTSTNGIYRTDENGRFTITGLLPGTYVVTETKAPQGYVLNTEAQTVTVNASDAQTVTIRNTPLQSLTITKYEAGTTKPLSGVVFSVTDMNGTRIGSGEYTTDANGQIVLTGLTPGMTLVVREVRTVKGYVLNGVPQTIQVGADNASPSSVPASSAGTGSSLVFYDVPLSTLVIHSYVDGTENQPLSGVTFKVVDSGGKPVGNTDGIFTADDSGEIVIGELEPGAVIKVREIKTVDGYVLNPNPQDIEIHNSNLHELTFWNKPTQSLTVDLFAADSETAIPGGEFLVTDQTGKPVGTSSGEYRTDGSGRITIPGLAPGMSVTVKQTQTAEGYFIPEGSTKTILIQSGDVQSLRFYNKPTQTLILRLFKAGTTDSIPGAAFHITDGDGKKIGSSNGDFLTDANGEITISGLIPGVSIIAKETRTVSGYVLDTTPQTIAIREGEAQSLIFYNAPKGALVLKAQDSVTGQFIAGIELRITTANGDPVDSNEGKTSSNGIYRTDESGQAALTMLQPGIYSIVETRAPEGYVLNTEPQTVEIYAEDTQTLIFRNIPKQTLTVQIYEEETTKPIPGVAVLLKDSGGAVIGTENGEFTADANGQITVSGLIPGVTVKAQEIRTVAGYVLNNIPQTIRIQSGDAQKLTFFNVPTQALTIECREKGTAKPLQGVAFLLVDGSGAPLGSGEYVTDENGRISMDDLEPGVTVMAREIRTIPGYQLNGNPQYIQIVSGQASKLTFYEKPLSTLILRLYVDGTENEPLSGAAFKVVDGNGKAVGPDDGVCYTDKAGMVTLHNLEPGITVKARLIQVPEGFALDGTAQDILMESGDVQSLTFWVKRSGSLTLRALDSVTRQGIPNVEFKVVYADGRVVDTANGNVSSNGRYFTDSNGEIYITGIVGTIVATEEQTASGYTMDSANRSQTVVVRPADGQTLTFFDTPSQSLTVRLYEKDTTTPISGARFLLTDGTGARLGNEDGNFATDESGQFTLSGLIPGTTVRVQQLSTSGGYLPDGAVKTITIKTGNGQTVTVYNSPKQTLTVKLYEKGTTTPIAGAKFLLRDSAGTLVGDAIGVYTTDRNGEFSVTGLAPGVTITAVQTDTVSGFVLDSTPQSILIKSGSAQSLVFYNAPKGALTVRKIDAMTEKPLSGAEFKIVTIGGAPVDDNEGKTSTSGLYRTDENGEINILKLEPGIYTVTETKAPAGYALDSPPQTVTVNENDRQTLIFRDNALQSLTIKKYESGTNHPLSGVVFLVTDSTGARIGEYTTDANGEITIPGLTPGTVLVVREIRTVNGYVLNGTPQTITIGGGTSTLVPGAAFGTVADTGNVLTFYDEPLSTLVIHKYAAGTERTPLSGVEFRLTDGSGAAVGNGTYYTNRSGEIRVENLEPGTTVTVRETKTVSDYVLDGTPQTVKIPSGDVLEMVFWNARKQALTVQKYVRNTTTPIPGTAFLITDSIGAPVGPSNGEYVTDENGQIVLSDLTPGVTITVKEIRAAEGYALDAAPKSILIQSGATQTLQFYNSPTGTLMITKRDKTTEKPLKGAVFQILTADGNYVPNAGGQLSSNGLYTTDSKGQILLTGLSAETLVVRETKAPEGYLLDDAPQTVRVSPGSTQSLTFYDTPEQALTIQKYIDGTTKPIAGVTFLITDSSGAVVGSSNGEYQTDRNGRIVLTGLIPGTTVTAKETKTVPGYVLDTTPQSILIKEGAAQTLTFYNQASGGLELIKADAADKTIRIPYTTFEIRKLDGALVKTITTGRDGRIYTDLEAGDYALVEIEAANGYKLDPTPEYFTVRNGKTTTVTVTNTAVSGILLHKIDASTGKPIYGVTFLLYNAGNTPIGQYSTDNQGYIRIEGLEAGVYFLRELENKGYVPDTQMKTVYVKSGETTLIEWKNIPVTAQIQITKRSADYNPTNGLPAMTLLEGAVFEIRDKAGNLMDTVQSNRSGLALTKPLPLGRYTIRETKAPAYYGINETEWTAYLEHEGQIVRFEITDKSLVTGVSMTKTGPKQVMSGQPVIYRFSGIGNTSNVRLENFYWRDKVPAQVRLQSVVTGTYNFPGSYKITYRVNGGEPRTLADNLSTQKNYTLAASPAALKLASNEQVTEIMFVFGQVPAGFAQVEAPSLNCTAVSNIQASSFVNEADVGGTYNSQWIQSVSRWVTSVYKAPTKLPRTGY